MRPITLLLTFVVSLSYILACTDDRSSLEELDIVVAEHFTLGLTDDDFFGRPVDVATDSEGNIYVLDQEVPVIRVFSSDGTLKDSIGERGEGPGEFSRPHALYIDAEDRMLVADRDAYRISALTTEGEFIDNWTMSTTGDLWVMPSRFQAIGDTSFFVQGTPWVYNEEEPPNELLYKISLDNSRQHVAEQWLPRDTVLEEASAAFDPGIGLDGSSLFTSAGHVLYAPLLYDGYVFALSAEDRNHSNIQRWTGYVETERAYKELDPSSFEMDSRFPSDWRTMRFSEGESVAGRAHNTSHGLSELSDGRIIHFTQIRIDEERLFGLELFDKDGVLQGYASLDGLADEGLFDLVVRDLGKSDRLAIISRNDGVPVVRVVGLEFEL